MISKARQALLDDAKAAGYSIEVHQDGVIDIVKRVGRCQKPRGLRIYENGVAFMVDVRLDIARGIRTYKIMRSVLGIKAAKAGDR